MSRHQTLLLTILLLSIFLLQNTNADRREVSSSIHNEHFPSARQTPSKSISDQLLLVTPIETPPISEKPLAPTQESDNQKGWFGKLKSKAKDSLKIAKEAIYSHIPDSITENAHNIGDKAKRFSDSVANQAERFGHKAEQIYDKVSHKISQEIKHQTQPHQEIYLAADFIDQDEEGNERPLPEKNNDELPSGSPLDEKNNDELPSGSPIDEKKGMFGTFRQKMSDVSNSVKNKVKYASISKSFSNKFKSIKEKTENLIHAPSKIDLKGTFSNLGKNIQAIPQKISQKFSDITTAEKTGSWFSQSFNKITQKMKQAIPKISLTEKMSPAYQGIKDSVKGKLTGAFDRIKQAIPTTIPFKEKITSAFQGVKDRAISPVFNLFGGAKDSISRFGSSAKGKFTGAFDKIKQVIPTAIPFKENISSAYHQVKDHTIPSISNTLKGAKDTISRFGSSAKGKLAETFDKITPKILTPVYGIMNFGSWMWNLMAWRKLLYWIVGIIIGCLFLKAFLFLLPFIQMTVSILKTPFQVFFMLTSLFKQFYPKETPENGSQRQRNEPAAEVKKKTEPPKEKDRSYYRYSSSQEEWRRASHHELHEPTRPRDLDSEQVRRRFEDVQENQERYYNYYRCYGCNQQWENVTIGKGPVQECRTEGCKYSFGPYHQIPLLNNKQKKEEFDKVKTE